MYRQSSFAQRRRFQICFHLPEDQNIKWDIHLLTPRDPWMHCENALIRIYIKKKINQRKIVELLTQSLRGCHSLSRIFVQ